MRSAKDSWAPPEVFFSSTIESPLDAASMHPDPKSLLHPLHELAWLRWRNLRTQHLLDEIQNLLRKLVSLLRTRAARQEPSEALTFETLAGGIERRSRKAEPGRRLGDRGAVDADPPQHLVLHLNEVLAVEEVVFGEQRVAHELWSPVEAAVLFQELSFGRHVKSIMPYLEIGCKLINALLGNWLLGRILQRLLSEVTSFCRRNPLDTLGEILLTAQFLDQLRQAQEVRPPEKTPPVPQVCPGIWLDQVRPSCRDEPPWLPGRLAIDDDVDAFLLATLQESVLLAMLRDKRVRYPERRTCQILTTCSLTSYPMASRKISSHGSRIGQVFAAFIP